MDRRIELLEQDRRDFTRSLNDRGRWIVLASFVLGAFALAASLVQLTEDSIVLRYLVKIVTRWTR
jgi:hypothetical protein